MANHCFAPLSLVRLPKSHTKQRSNFFPSGMMKNRSVTQPVLANIRSLPLFVEQDVVGAILDRDLAAAAALWVAQEHRQLPFYTVHVLHLALPQNEHVPATGTELFHVFPVTCRIFF